MLNAVRAFFGYDAVHDDLEEKIRGVVAHFKGIPIERVVDTTELGEKYQLVINEVYYKYGRRIGATPHTTFGEIVSQCKPKQSPQRA